jgi:hypothetical protein
MPPSLIGFELGTVVVKGVTVKFHDEDLHGKAEVRLATSGAYTKIKQGTPTAKEASAEDSDSDEETGRDTLIQLPILTRYHSALVLNARNKGLLRKSTLAMGTVWLRDLVDNHHEGIVRATLWKGDNLQEIRQNYSKPEENVPGVQGEAIGEVELRVVFRPGIEDVHEKDMREDSNTQRLWEEYVIMKREGLRNAIGRPDTQAQLGLDNHNRMTDKVQQIEIKSIDPPESHGVLVLLARLSLFILTTSLIAGSFDGEVEDWADHPDSLGAGHRGIKQFKGVTKAEWITGKVRDALAGVAS